MFSVLSTLVVKIGLGNEGESWAWHEKTWF